MKSGFDLPVITNCVFICPPGQYLTSFHVLAALKKPLEDNCRNKFLNMSQTGRDNCSYNCRDNWKTIEETKF